MRQKKQTDLSENNSWVLHHNTLHHASLLIYIFLAKNNTFLVIKKLMFLAMVQTCCKEPHATFDCSQERKSIITECFVTRAVNGKMAE